MWPQALQMTRDECRGVLRRLELESYSHVISVFRAQGGLSDSKAKLLEELRGIFHISQERHRAEARRVANDEQLSTIAEAISGPNTWQEWSREGRRSFPMLPRVAPQTALALIANSVANEAAAENAKLPYPSETAAAIAEEQAAYAICDGNSWGTERSTYVVTSDPFKMPDIPAAAVAKKNLKRNMSDGHGGSNKKRSTGDSASPTKHQLQQQHKQQYQHITANSSNVSSTTSNASNIRKLYNNHNKLQQQRYFHQQQQLQKQKMANKKSVAVTAAANTATPAKRQTTPAKCGRRAQKQQQQLQHQQQLQQQHQQAEQLLHAQLPLQQLQAPQQQQQHTRNMAYISNTHDLSAIDVQEESVSAVQTYALGMPQIAASKKDITKNLTKLQIHAATAGASASTANIMLPNAVARINAMEQHVVATSPTAITPLIISSKSGEKQLISTPVQKYIVEDRQPPPPTAPTSIVVSSSSSTSTTGQLQVSTAPQIMTLPQLSAAANKLRAVNTTLLPPGTKLTTKKLPASSVVGGTSATLLEHNLGGIVTGTGSSTSTSQPQVFNIIEGTTISSNASGSVGTPTHTVPAVIQLQHGINSNNSMDSISLSQQQTPTQGKVLTTKILPMVLAGTVTNSSAIGGTTVATSTSNISKIETLNNGSTIISTGGGNNATAVGTIIKSLPSTMLLTTGQSGSGGIVGSNNSSTGNTIISTLGTGATVFRKPPNIIKTNIIGVGASGVLTSGGTAKLTTPFSTNNSNSGGPQIISNVKLTPAIVSTALSNTTNTGAGGNTLSPQQQFLKTVPTTGIRTSVKICQSPNGKVFIQPANVDAATKAKLQGALPHKLLTANALVSSATGVGSGTSTTAARVSIQKVQIIPAPMSSPGGGKTTLTLSAGNKSNMIFVPTTATRTAGGTITLTKNNLGANIVATKGHPPTAAQTGEVSKATNVVVVSATSLSAQTTQPLTFKTSAISTLSPTPSAAGTLAMNTSAGGSNSQLESSQMITEDTPVDILNMPIIVDSSGGGETGGGSNIGDTVTVLATGDFQLNAQATPQPTVILGATDWEMELDQATAVAAATKARSQRRRISSGGGGGGGVQRQRKSYSEQQVALTPEQRLQTEGQITNAIVIDDCFEDVIVEEQEDDLEVVAQVDQIEQQAQHDGEDNHNVILLDDKRPKMVMGGPQKLLEDEVPIEIIDESVEQQAKENAKANVDVLLQQATTNSNTNMAAANECETDAGFDETIVTEIDENTAIEYIEEDHSDEKGNIDPTTNKAVTEKMSSHNTAALHAALDNDGENMPSTKMLQTTKELNASNTLSLSAADNVATYTQKEDYLFTTMEQELEQEQEPTTIENSYLEPASNTSVSTIKASTVKRDGNQSAQEVEQP